MKREITFRDKIRIFINLMEWFKEREDSGLVASCSYCQSTRVKKVHSNTDGIQRDMVTYTASYECLNCKATATCQEVWVKNE